MQSFDGHHPITSGQIALDLTVLPRGSSSITGPIEFSFGGPFMNQGAGKLPESDFTISISAEGRRGALQVISANGKGYVTVGGQSYLMPHSSYKSLESGFGSLAAAGTGSGSSSASASKSAFSALGIKPLGWLVSPQIVGKSTVDGVATTHVRAGLDAKAMLEDFSRLLGKTGSLGISGSSSLPHSLSADTQRSIAHALGSPSFNLWTGASDKLIRKLTVSATIPVTGSTRTQLRGMRSALVTIGFQYSDVNQPQTFSVPTATKPYSVFRAQVATVLQEIESALFTGSGSPGTSTGTTTSASGGLAADPKYRQCIKGAHGDVANMQKCSKLLATG